MKKSLKAIVPIILWICFFSVIFLVEYPTSFANASFYQLGAFFVPLLLALFFTLKIFIKSFYKVSILCFGVILLLILQALQVLNIVTFAITLVAIYLLLGSFNNSAK